MADNSESDATPYPEEFILETDFTPKGDQPQAIRNLIDGYKNGLQWQTLLGVTGSGKSLDFDQQIILLNQDGLVEKVKIGEFVEKQLTNPQTINDTNYQNVTGAQIISFDPKDYEINLMKIIQVSKHKEDQLFQIELDDYSKIRVTKDHNCYKLINDDLKLVRSKDLTVGDYLPTSNFLPEPQNPVVFIDLLEDENITNHLNIRSLILDNPIYVETTRKIVSQEYVAYGHKVNQILKGSPDRGLNQSLVQQILESLQISSYEARDKLNLITSGDSISPIIDINDEFLTFAGLYVTEGHITRSYILMSNSDKGLQYICKKFFTDIGLNYTIRNENDIQFNSSIMAEFFKKFGTNSYNKRIPNLIYNVSNDDLRIFMRALFDGDGRVEDGKVCYSSISEELVFDIKNLLLRFNITSRIREKIVNWNSRDKMNFVLSISGESNLSLYYDQISFSVDYKIKKLLGQLRNFRKTNVDLFPNSGHVIKEYRIKNGLSQRDLAKFLGCQRSYISLVENGKRNPSKHLMEKFALISNNHNLMNLLNFNFRRIVSIKKVKPSNGFVYDIAVNNNENFMAGSGNIFVHNTFTASRVINEINLPTLVMAPNKTLAAQLFAEFKTLFPKNAVEFFVSFYDYYQPEAYLPTKDLYIDKDFNINEEIEKMRNSTTRALAERRDVIVVASVSCIYNVGLPETYRSSTISIFIGMNLERDI
ncbi:MAG: helix-turn-helix domain-containing protein, partial [Candidatus Heimdallarchaeota archaeon]|nr:helix-turn-helix domain-containing protein [Candidatus Heimdallarchaeota archaeon]